MIKNWWVKAQEGWKAIFKRETMTYSDKGLGSKINIFKKNIDKKFKIITWEGLCQKIIDNWQRILFNKVKKNLKKYKDELEKIMKDRWI